MVNALNHKVQLSLAPLGLIQFIELTVHDTQYAWEHEHNNGVIGLIFEMIVKASFHLNFYSNNYLNRSSDMKTAGINMILYSLQLSKLRRNDLKLCLN